MNERDLQLVGAISEVIEETNEPSIYLFDTRYTNVARLNLVVLKAFLEKKDKKGIMITIDRPHQYISHLMQLHGIDQTNLFFVDAISSHSSDTKASSVDSVTQEGPFHIETLPKFLLESERENVGPMADLKEIGFIMIDNVSTLLVYNPVEKVEEFFGKYVQVIKELKPNIVQTALVMDGDQQPMFFEFISSFSKKIVEVGPEMTLKNVSKIGELTRKLISTGPQVVLGSGKSEKDVSGTRW
jgi:hypothetical protein